MPSSSMCAAAMSSKRAISRAAVCIPLPEIGKAARLYGTKKLYVYCASGARSRQAVAQLRAAGIESAENIGGISSWRGPIACG